ncbi:MAG: hypothetical protein II968_04065, partial [Selenomonadaceae bacterium]|nr:hypothetical protein [Selenomonadaceae bacterium]
MTDDSGNPLYSTDGKVGKFSNDIGIEKTGETYTLSISEDTEIYAYNPPEMEDHLDAVVEYTAYSSSSTPVSGTLLSAVPTALSNQLTTTRQALSALTQPTASANIGDVAIPNDATGISWTVVDANGNEVDNASSYAVRSFNNSDNNTDYFRLYVGTADDAAEAATGLKIAVKYSAPKAEETSVEENGLDKAWDKFGKAVYTPDKTKGIAFGSTVAGVNYQISGLTVNILDQDGNVKKAANAALDQFKQYQRAENETGDMSLNFHIGSEANVAFKVGLGDMRAQALGLKGSDGTRIDVYTKDHANAAINVIENALTKALDQQTTIGAIEARLEYTSTNLTTSSENVQAAESTIRDADMAKE